MVWFLNGGLKTGLKMSVYGLKYLIFEWFPNHVQTVSYKDDFDKISLGPSSSRQFLPEIIWLNIRPGVDFIKVGLTAQIKR